MDFSNAELYRAYDSENPKSEKPQPENNNFEVGVINDESEENVNRGNWSNQFDFILSALGYAVGLGNVWRFPYLCYKNGGGIFFIPYFIFLAFVGIPIFLLELSMGQFTSQCQLTCWNNAKLFTGIGVAMTLVSGLVGIYYNVIIAWSCWYLFASFTAKLPWSDCTLFNSTNLCWTKYNEITATACETLSGGTYNAKQGICYVNGVLHAVVDKALAKEAGLSKRTVAEDYLIEVGFQTKDSTGMDNLGPLRWDMSLTLLLAWIIPMLCLIKGIKSSGKVVYFTAIFPYVVLIILFIRGLLLDGYEDGIRYYITPNITKLNDSQVWKDAAAQIFFSLSAAFGGMIVYASYNKFHTNVVRDTFIVCIGNCCTSIFAGFVIFSYIGYLAKILQVDIEDVAKSGVTLAFVVYPQAVTTLPLPTLWSILFFLMLITLGLDSQFAFLETIISAIIDVLMVTGKITKVTTKTKAIIVVSVCLVGFFLSLIMATPGGPYILTLMDDYCGGWNLMLIALFECACVAWFYSGTRFCKDIDIMVTGKGKRGKFCGPASNWLCCRWYWIICWTIITPALVTFVMIFSIVRYKGSTYGTYTYPDWANALGWCMSMFVVAGLVITPIYYLIRTPGETITHRWIQILTPNKYWGPALPSHRREVKESHAPRMLIYPDRVGEIYENPTLEYDEQY